MISAKFSTLATVVALAICAGAQAPGSTNLPVAPSLPVSGVHAPSVSVPVNLPSVTGSAPAITPSINAPVGAPSVSNLPVSAPAPVLFAGAPSGVPVSDTPSITAPSDRTASSVLNQVPVCTAYDVPPVNAPSPALPVSAPVGTGSLPVSIPSSGNNLMVVPCLNVGYTVTHAAASASSSLPSPSLPVRAPADIPRPSPPVSAPSGPPPLPVSLPSHAPSAPLPAASAPSLPSVPVSEPSIPSASPPVSAPEASNPAAFIPKSLPVTPTTIFSGIPTGTAQRRGDYHPHAVVRKASE